MKHIIGLLFLCICIVSSCFGQSDKLQQYLDESNFFKLRQLLPSAILPGERRLYYEAFVTNAFNQNKISIEKADSLLQSRTIRADKKKTGLLLELQMDNYTKLYNYKKAADCGDTILARYTEYIDNEPDVRNVTKIWRALEATPPQILEKKGDVTIRIKRDKSKLWNIPVHTADTTIDFIFDTGANISTITESTARRMHVKRLNISFDVADGQGKKTKTDIGVADSIEIGDIKLRNVIFLIMPDANLSFPGANYYIRGIIGYPVLAAMKEIHISSQGALTVPLVPTKTNLQNLALDGLFPMINLATDDDTLVFHFDSGAMISELYSNYYELHKKEIRQSGRSKHIRVGGAGGIKKLAAYKVKNFNLYIGDKKATLKSISILKKQVDSKELVYGNIGQDLIRQFDEMVINFESMYIEFN